MRRAYVIIGELENGKVSDVYAVCHTMERAEELCLEAEQERPELLYTWYNVVEEEDE